MKKFLKGFLLGLGYLLVWAVISNYMPESYLGNLTLFAWAISLIIVIYVRNRYKLPYVWVLVGFLFGILLIPFLFGVVSLNQTTPSPQKKM